MVERPKTTFNSFLTNRSAAKLRKLSPNDDDPLISVNVSGVEYKVKSSYLSRFPDSLLYKIVYDRQDNNNDDDSTDVTQTTLTSLPPSYECSVPSYGDDDDGAGRRETVVPPLTTSPPPRQKKLFFQRSPLIFDLVILQSYITGKLHVPRWMCAESILEELKFWQMDISYACSCCAEERQEVESRDSDNEEASTPALPDESETSALLLAKKDGKRPSMIAKRFSIPYAKRQSVLLLSRWQRKKRHMWTFVQDPSSSFGALLFAIVSLLFVFLSIAHLTVESFRSFSFCPLDSCLSNSTNRLPSPSSSSRADFNDRRFSISINPNLSSPSYDPTSTATPDHAESPATSHSTTNWTVFFGNATTTEFSGADSNSSMAEMGDDPMQIAINEAPCQYLSACSNRRVLQYFEFLTMAWFTLELILRVICCPGCAKFLRSPLNLIDVVSTVPFYVELTVILIRQAERSHPAHKAILVLQLLRCLRVFRILKLARYFEELRILGNTLKAAKKELCMLFLFVSIAIFMFSSIIYQFEKDQPNTLYTNIPASAWFGIATVTTVGYGDMTPSTTAGKIIASIACITGVMITAFPVSILVEHFTSTYKNKGKRMFIVPQFKYRIPFHKGRRNNQKDSASKDIVMVRSQTTRE